MYAYCTRTKENYSFVTQWSAYANDTSYIPGIAVNSSGTVYTTDAANSRGQL
jgi:hypothetical protein